MIKGLYRGLTKTDKKLVYGAYVFKSGTGNVYRTKDMHLISKPDVLSRIVYEDTVCMYTGKDDKEGNKIFEKDILEIEDKLYVVGELSNARFLLEPYNYEGDVKYLHEIPSCLILIAGNTIENGEVK